MFKNYYYSEIHLFEYPSCSKYILQQTGQYNKPELWFWQ